jgi:hypothetical protein
MKNKPTINLANLQAGLAKEQNEIAQDKRYQQEIETLLKNRSSKILHVREGISLLASEVILAKELRAKIIRFDSDYIPHKSEIYRMGLLALKDKTVEELLRLYQQIKEY